MNCCHHNNYDWQGPIAGMISVILLTIYVPLAIYLIGVSCLFDPKLHGYAYWLVILGNLFSRDNAAVSAVALFNSCWGTLTLARRPFGKNGLSTAWIMFSIVVLIVPLLLMCFRAFNT
jgi:hypothetical protein